MTQYQPSMIVSEPAHQALATGFPVGKRFKSAPVERVAEGNPAHLGHHARADGRWRVYAFADAAAPGEPSALREWAEWLGTAPGSPLLRHTPAGTDPDSVLDVKVVYQQDHFGVEFADVPEVFTPRVGPFGLVDYEKVYATDPAAGHLRAARHRPRRRRRRRAARPVRCRRAAAERDGRAPGRSSPGRCSAGQPTTNMPENMSTNTPTKENA